MKTIIDIEECVKDAKYIFNNGYACSESVIYALNKHFEFNLSSDAIAMSSSFPWGLGGGGCICGAVAGSAMCLGFLFGRREPNDDCINNCFKLSEEFHNDFKKEFKSTCCRVLTKGMERQAPERKARCTEYVGFAAETAAKIIMRELNKKEN